MRSHAILPPTFFLGGARLIHYSSTYERNYVRAVHDACELLCMVGFESSSSLATAFGANLARMSIVG